MCKYLIIVIGILSIVSSALCAESVDKTNESHHFGKIAAEEVWSQKQVFQIRENFINRDDKYSKSKLTINIMDSDSISIPVTVKIKNFETPKVRLNFKITF